MKWGTIAIIAVIAVIVFFAIRSSIKHIKGDGGCCGGGGSVAEESKKLTGPVIAQKTLYIEGMHCDNCRNSVMRQLQKIDGVSASVHLKKNLAVVSLDREVSDEELIRAVERVDFKVSRIENMDS
jgi:copper chaperone CopZ